MQLCRVYSRVHILRAYSDVYTCARSRILTTTTKSDTQCEKMVSPHKVLVKNCIVVHLLCQPTCCLVLDLKVRLQLSIDSLVVVDCRLDCSIRTAADLLVATVDTSRLAAVL